MFIKCEARDNGAEPLQNELWIFFYKDLLVFFSYFKLRNPYNYAFFYALSYDCSLPFMPVYCCFSPFMHTRMLNSKTGETSRYYVIIELLMLVL